MNQIWQIGTEQFGPSPIGPECTHATYHRPFNVAFFCPHCGDIWARRIVNGGEPQWVLWHRPCERHPNELSRGLSGSVWQNYDTEYLKNLPLDILRREFLIHMETLNEHSVLSYS